MKNLLYCMLVFAIALTQACKKKKETIESPVETSPLTSSPVTYDNYSQLKVGNYWIYERFNVDVQGGETSQNTFDSCYISKDTIIHGQTYFKYHSTGIYSPEHFVRDSLHYLISSFGEILFSSQNFTTVFQDFYSFANPNDTICHCIYKMANKDVLAITPAGNFTTSCFQKKFVFYPNWSQGVTYRYMNTSYAKNIGMITETQQIFTNLAPTVERRLKRYHLN